MYVLIQMWKQRNINIDMKMFTYKGKNLEWIYKLNYKE